jgi:hypothetical protein
MDYIYIKNKLLINKEDIAMKEPINKLSISIEQLNFYREQGYVVIKNLIQNENLNEIYNEIMSYMNIIGLGECKLKQTSNYVKGSAVDGLIHSTNLCSIASQLLEGQAQLYCPFTAVKGAKGGGEFDYHQDNSYTEHRGSSLNLWCALVDMKIENGCLYIDPKSHKKGTLESEVLEDKHRKVKAVKPIPLIVKAGSCVAFSRLCVHGSGFNSSDEHRVAYAVQYHRHDTEALFDNSWELLSVRPRWEDGGVAKISEL